MKRRAFTLVELLIVVVILGILAAIVVPQFSQASTDAQTNSLLSDLQVIRGQLELYKMQHNGSYPVLASFTAQMTGKTDAAGAAGGSLGPYLLKVPANPFMSGSSAGTVTKGAAGSSGW